MNKFSERLKELRNERGLSQGGLAVQINVSTACVSRWESELRVPDIDSIIKLCKYFGCTADFLIGLDD